MENEPFVQPDHRAPADPLARWRRPGASYVGLNVEHFLIDRPSTSEIAEHPQQATEQP